MVEPLEPLDPLMALPAVGSIVAAAFGSPLLAGALLAVACLTKAQAVFIMPVVVLASWTAGRGRSVAAAASGGAARA